MKFQNYVHLGQVFKEIILAKSIPIRNTTIPSSSVELKELLFNNNNELNVLKALIICESHNAFSRIDCLYGIQTDQLLI